MRPRVDLPTLFFVFAFGCGGQTQAASDGGGGDASLSGSRSGSNGSVGGGSSGSGSGGGAGSDSSGGYRDDAGAGGSGGGGSGSSSGGGSGSESGAGSGGVFDAEIPDAFPATCGQCTPLPDAAPHTCAFTPADVACNTSADCDICVWISCGCVDSVYGVNVTSTRRCPPPPPCPPPAPGSVCSSSGYEPQDCRLVPDPRNVAVACIDHQCLTYAASVGSE